MTGWAVSKFSAVRFNPSHSSRTIGNLARTRGLTARCSSQGFMRAHGAPRTTAASRASRHATIPAYHAPIEIPHSATAGQLSFSSQPIRARISAIPWAVASAICI